MDAASLFRQAEKYRSIAKGINDETALALLEEMACALERRARRLQSLKRLSRPSRKGMSLTGS
jgi:hypothetical protein